MPFSSKSQLRACWAKKDPKWDCHEFAKETKNMKDLPERVKKAMDENAISFSKIAKGLFNPTTNPPVPHRVLQTEQIAAAKQEKTKGLGPVAYRNELTSRRTGVVQKNKESNRS